MEWLIAQGACVSIPFGHSPHYDLVADFGAALLRVQVKTSMCWRNGRYDVSLVTRGGNQTWSGVVKFLDTTQCDYLFVHVGDGRRWFIPVQALGGSRGLLLGGPKYAAFEVERGVPLPRREPYAQPAHR